MIFPHELMMVCPHAKDRWPSLLERGRNLIDGARQADYGTPEENFAEIAKLFSKALGMDVSPSKAARLMQLVKLARLKQSPHHEDSLVDYAAYVLIEGDLST